MFRRVLPAVSAVALAVVVAAAGGACRSARGSAMGSPVTTDSTVSLVVRNNNFADVDVWVVSFGLPTRVGVVTGNTTQSFILDPSVARATDLRIVATPIGGNGRAGTGPIVVQSGQTIEFTVGSRLRQSNVAIH